MPITIACQHCDWKGRVKDDLAGKKGKCPTCGELVPIPKKGTPPPVRTGKSAVDDEPDVVDEADIVEDEPRPATKRSTPARRDEDDEDDRPRKARRRDEDDEDDRPARSRRRDEDDEDERPRKARRRDDDDDEDERPARARRRRDEEDDDDDERPARSRRRRDEDDEDDYQPRRSKRLADEDDDRPRRPRRKPRPQEGGVNMQMVGGGIVMLLLMIVWFACGLLFLDRIFIYPPIGAVIAGVAIIRGLMGKTS